LSCLVKKIDETVSFGPKITNPKAGGQGGGVQKNATGSGEFHEFSSSVYIDLRCVKNNKKSWKYKFKKVGPQESKVPSATGVVGNHPSGRTGLAVGGDSAARKRRTGFSLT
jgi:hypothetical protein